MSIYAGQSPEHRTNSPSRSQRTEALNPKEVSLEVHGDAPHPVAKNRPTPVHQLLYYKDQTGAGSNVYPPLPISHQTLWTPVILPQNRLNSLPMFQSVLGKGERLPTLNVGSTRSSGNYGCSVHND